ncbi:MAG: hypothetical protein ABWY25_09050 [Paenisporosarcina sp.]
MPSSDKSDFITLVTIVTLGVIVMTAIIGLTIVAVTTDRELLKAEFLIFIIVLLIATLGGVSWVMLRRRKNWHINVEHSEDGQHE